MMQAPPSPTRQLITHMLALTRHRDHHLLDMALVAALHDLTLARQVRLIDIVKHRGAIFLRPRIWIQHGHTVPSERESTTPPTDEAMSQHPFLQEAIDRHLPMVTTIDLVDSANPTTQTGQVSLANNVWVTLWRNDEAIGFLQICSEAALAAPVLELVDGMLGVYRNQRDLLDYSERDSLTGLLNRKTFDEKFSRLVALDTHRKISLGGSKNTGDDTDPERRQHALIPPRWLAVIDIDFFKRINDRFGHLYGDEVLILIGNLLRTSFRSEDLIFRFGGEEFVVLLCSSSVDQARMVFERLRANIEAHQFPQVGTVTITLGFTCITDATPVMLLGQADQALYFGKAHGRNQICFFDELLQEGLLETMPTSQSEVLFFDDLPAADTDLAAPPAT